MSPIAQLLLRFARWVAGAERADWISAMEAEASTLGRQDAGWAFGCATAALRDRLWRERTSFFLMVLAPIGATLFCLLLFFPLSRLFLAGWLSSLTISTVMLLAPLPFAWVLGRMRPNAALATATTSFVIFAMIPGFVHWIQFGASPLIFFAANAEWNGMPAYIGIPCNLLVWLVGASIGSRWQRANT
jgi:hypothetical protein